MVRPLAIVAMLLALVASSIGESPDAPTPQPVPIDGPTRVLLVGNSYTYFNDLDAKLDAILSATGRRADVHTVARGGAKLADHRRSGSIRNAEGPWHVVVIQGQSREPIRDPRAMSEHASALVAEARAHGATPIFFMTWPRAGRPQDGPAIAHAYRKLARTHDARLAPVGVAFERARATHPAHHRQLYTDDGSHPSELGSWLAALCLAARITDGDLRAIEPPTDLAPDVFSILAEWVQHAVDAESVAPR